MELRREAPPQRPATLANAGRRTPAFFVSMPALTSIGH
jgi:hypothetical protein